MKPYTVMEKYRDGNHQMSQSSAVRLRNEYSPVPVGPAVRAPEAKMLGHTDSHTDLQTNIGPTTFLERPTRGNLRAKLSMLTH